MHPEGQFPSQGEWKRFIMTNNKPVVDAIVHHAGALGVTAAVRHTEALEVDATVHHAEAL